MTWLFLDVLTGPHVGALLLVSAAKANMDDDHLPPAHLTMPGA